MPNKKTKVYLSASHISVCGHEDMIFLIYIPEYDRLLCLGSKKYILDKIPLLERGIGEWVFRLSINENLKRHGRALYPGGDGVEYELPKTLISKIVSASKAQEKSRKRLEDLIQQILEAEGLKDSLREVFEKEEREIKEIYHQLTERKREEE